MSEVNQLPELVQRLRTGDREALSEYLEAKRAPLAAFINRHLGPVLRKRIEVEDLVQDTNLAAVESFTSEAIAHRDPFSWLCRLGEQRIVNAYRRLVKARKRSAQEVSLDGVIGPGTGMRLIDLLVASLTTPSSAFSRDEVHLRLAAAVSALPPEAQEALRLRYIENLPSKEIAGRMSKSDAAVRVMLTRAVQKLQTDLNLAGG